MIVTEISGAEIHKRPSSGGLLVSLWGYEGRTEGPEHRRGSAETLPSHNTHTHTHTHTHGQGHIHSKWHRKSIHAHMNKYTHAHTVYVQMELKISHFLLGFCYCQTLHFGSKGTSESQTCLPQGGLVIFLYGQRSEGLSYRDIWCCLSSINKVSG